MFVWVCEYLSEQTKQIHTPVTNSPPNTPTAETTKIKGWVGNRSKQLKGTNFTEILGKVKHEAQFTQNPPFTQHCH